MVQEWLAAAVGTLMLLGSSTAAIMNKRQQPAKERPASSTKQITKVDAACVGAAVATRESALIAAINTQGDATAAAYTARASALASAYAGTDSKTVRSSVKKAWDSFNGSMKTAKKNWLTSRDGAWKTFRTAVQACGAAAAEVTDAANSTTEAKGE